MAKELSKQEKLRALMKEVNKDFKGRNPLQFASDAAEKGKISTGVELIDVKIGGGFQRGNVSIIYGGPGCGKSSICLHSTAKAQADGSTVMYIDLEHKFDAGRAKDLGVKLDELILIKDIQHAEEAMDILKRVCSEGLVDLIIVDSIQGMSPEGEQVTKKGKEKSFADDEMGILARKLSKFFRGIANDLDNGKAALLMVGQLRMNLGSFIVKGKLSGGNALEHFAVLIAQVRRGQKANAPVDTVKETYLDEETEQERFRTVKVPIGFECVMKVEKCHIHGGSREGTDFSMPFYFDTGFLPPKENNVDETENKEETSDESTDSQEVVESKEETNVPKKTRGRKPKGSK